MECGCGRSPTGKCIGWHKLSEEEYLEKLEEYKDKEKKEDQKFWKKQIRMDVSEVAVRTTVHKMVEIQFYFYRDINIKYYV